MEKIATLTCLVSNHTCARMGCLRAFREREAFFSGYPEDTVLAAAMTCNGCRSMREAMPEDDPDMHKKIDSLVREGVTTVHVGACRIMKNGNECGRITSICRMLEEKGLRVVRGTHREG